MSDKKSMGIIGSGSWATALAKILTDNNFAVNWWFRKAASVEHLKKRNHNPEYLTSVYFKPELINPGNKLEEVIAQSERMIIAIPSAFLINTFKALPKDIFEDRQIISAIKGILPESNHLLNDYLKENFNVPADHYFSITGPCHAEEVAAEKLSYLTFAGINEAETVAISSCFNNDYIQTIVNSDIYGVQYAAVLKNIYALGAGIAHGLEYGDNFLSVFITNCFKEMQQFLQALDTHDALPPDHNYNASAYLGDLLVTCYSLYSRNRTFGNMIGKGYSVNSAKLELNMVAEGYYASKCLFDINKDIHAEIPIADAIYNILWKHQQPETAFQQLEKLFI